LGVWTKEEEPADITKRLNSIVSENVLSKKHYSTALSNEMKSRTLIILLKEGTTVKQSPGINL